MSGQESPPMSPEIWEKRREFYSSVGQAISYWADMEGSLVQVAARLLGTTDQKAGLILYSIMNFYTWLSIIEELFLLDGKFTTHKSDWGNISDRLRSLNNTRARLAHHTVWGYGDDLSSPLLRPGRYDARAKSKKQTPLTNEEIVSFINEVSSVEEAVYALHEALKTTSQKPANSSLGTLFERLGDPLSPADSQQPQNPKES